MSIGVAGLIARLKSMPRLLLFRRQPEPYLTNWKDYYHVLRIHPQADTATIAEAYARLMRVCRTLLSLKTQQTDFFAQRIIDTEEAYRILSDETRRAAYNKVLRAGGTAYQPSGNEEMDQLVTLMLKQMAKGRARRWVWPSWVRPTARTVAIATVVVVLLTAGGSSLAFARPQSALAKPFRGVAITIAETAAGAIGLIDDIRGVAADFERSVVSMSVQSMRITEGVKVVPAVTVSTNDMSVFPSKEHCLFPDYVDRRYSQFKYTVDSAGIVTVDTSWVTTDALLAEIRGRLAELGAE